MQKHHKNHVLVISDKKYKAQNQMKKLWRESGLKVTKRNFNFITTKKIKWTSRTPQESFRECFCHHFIFDIEFIDNVDDAKQFILEHEALAEGLDIDTVGIDIIEFGKWKKEEKK